MAVYYNYYDEYGGQIEPPDHQDFTSDTEVYYDVPAEQYDLGDQYGYEGEHADVHTDVYGAVLHIEEPAYYEEESCDDCGCMEIAYGEPGYWEEYERRRYEILYGDDAGEVLEECSVVDEAAFETAAPPFPRAASEDSAQSVLEEMRHSGDEDAWTAAWDLGPREGENELDWAESMEVWRQHLVEDVRGSVPSHNVAPDDYADLFSDESLAPAAACQGVEVEPQCDIRSQPTLEEMQELYDRGAIPEAEREDCARMLHELWACELEDQRLLAAGYVWDEETGEYVHPAEPDALLEYDRDADEFGVAHSPGYGAYDVQRVTELVAPAPPSPPARIRTPARPNVRASPPTFRRRSFPPPRPHFPPRRTFFQKSGQRRPVYSHSQTARRGHPRVPARTTKRREPPPHLLLISPSAPAAKPPSASVAAMAPASRATPPCVADSSRCSLHTGAIAPADVRPTKEPVPPDIAAATTTVSAPDAVVIPRLPKPPNIPLPAVLSIDSVPSGTVPNHPIKPVPPIVGLERMSAAAQRRVNAQRRLAKKGKG
ncbi:hypothetical protein DFH06DRAFT_1170132 [Mycena polygramma]|nr:hypothetical protein DFH06DRAFT_1170132 [Mycena polygramma]